MALVGGSRRPAPRSSRRCWVRQPQKAYRQKLVEETPAEWEKLEARAALVGVAWRVTVLMVRA